MTETCHDCHEEFNTWVELAQHIISQKSTHNRKSRVWALTFLAKKENIQEFKPKMPMSEETRKIIKECVRETSGEMKSVRTVCPNCKKVTEQRIEVEYLQDRGWRNSNGTLIVNCLDCRNK
jgi:hypothetical protein